MALPTELDKLINNIKDNNTRRAVEGLKDAFIELAAKLDADDVTNLDTDYEALAGDL